MYETDPENIFAHRAPEPDPDPVKEPGPAPSPDQDPVPDHNPSAFEFLTAVLLAAEF